MYFVHYCYASAAYATKRWVYVCLSVCPSVTFVHRVKTNKRIFKIFSPSGSQAILVLPYIKRHRTILTGTLNGGVECKGVWKKWRFSTNRSINLRSDARLSHSYYRSRIGNRTKLSSGTSFNELGWPLIQIIFKKTNKFKTLKQQKSFSSCSRILNQQIAI